ncbi:hypothetical protein HMPREF1173_01233 [Prevotella nigrescens CC14M]|uniref:Uncharacterized protein n=1 Tax=Prevotella nigrescens CC14M TaxID=1073366 RepID=V8CPQ1_9BACT|nr:hypothetical protein HMPREF1173_01233 [Prevotella nigrescens CC14M]
MNTVLWDEENKKRSSYDEYYKRNNINNLIWKALELIVFT